MLIESFAHISWEFDQAKLVLIGKAEDKNYEKTLTMKSNQPALENRITFLGHLPQSQLAHHMAEASVLVIPSLSEAWEGSSSKRWLAARRSLDHELEGFQR